MGETHLELGWSSGNCLLLHKWKKENICFPSEVPSRAFSSIFMGKSLPGISIQDVLEARSAYGTAGSSHPTLTLVRRRAALMAGWNGLQNRRRLTCMKYNHTCSYLARLPLKTREMKVSKTPRVAGSITPPW